MGNKNTRISDPTAEDETASLLAKAPNPVEGTSNFPTTGNTNTSVSDPTAEDKIASLVAEASTPVVIFSTTTCAICGAVETLFNNEFLIYPNVYNLDEYFPDQLGKEMERALIAKNGSLPLVYVGGKLVGDAKRVMDSHIKGDLAILLNEVGALKDAELYDLKPRRRGFFY